MKKIAVISDTHIPRKSKGIPEIVLDGIRSVDLIIHAGDINEDYVIYELEEIAPVVAVAGNTDDDYMRDKLGRSRILEIEGCRIGIVHGDGSTATTMERAARTFARDKVDCIIYGHSHIPVNEFLDGILFFNPGSPTDKRTQSKFSYGILMVDGGKISGEIIYFKKLYL